MRKVLKVRGFSRDNTGRMLKRGGMDRFGCPGYIQEDTAVTCNVRFGKVLMRFDESLQNRPYLQFVEGRLKSARVDLSEVKEVPWDEAETELDERSMPEVNLRWDLNNQEIIGLVQKGLFGFDYDIDHKSGLQPKPEKRGPVEIPSQFTSMSIEMDIPCDVRVLAAPWPEGGQTVPVIGLYPKDALDLRSNTREMGFGRGMDYYFAEPTFLQPEQYEAMDEHDRQAGMVFIDEADKLFQKSPAAASADIRKDPEMQTKETVGQFTQDEDRVLDLVIRNRTAQDVAKAERIVDDAVRAAETFAEEMLEQSRQESVKKQAQAQQAPYGSAAEEAERQSSYIEEKAAGTEEEEDNEFFR